MLKLKDKKAILIGYGGMGKRYEVALKNLNIKITHICDSKKNLIKMIIVFLKRITKIYYIQM